MNTRPCLSVWWCWGPLEPNSYAEHWWVAVQCVYGGRTLIVLNLYGYLPISIKAWALLASQMKSVCIHLDLACAGFLCLVVSGDSFERLLALIRPNYLYIVVCQCVCVFCFGIQWLFVTSLCVCFYAWMCTHDATHGCCQCGFCAYFQFMLRVGPHWTVCFNSACSTLYCPLGKNLIFSSIIGRHSLKESVMEWMHRSCHMFSTLVVSVWCWIAALCTRVVVLLVCLFFTDSDG